MLIILIAFLISFIVFFRLAKDKYKIIDIIYIFTINILGFAIGSKIFSLIDNKQTITIINFLNSGYGFIGGLIGSFISIYLYSKKYKLNYTKMQAYFAIIYPLIYSISKIGCFMNGCCGGIVQYFPFQLLECALMFFLFILLFYYSKNKNENSLIVIFLITFGIERFVIDYFRITRNILFLNFTLSQLCCLMLIVSGIVLKFTRNNED